MRISRVYDESEARKLGFFEDEDEQEIEFIKSDHCRECGGVGYHWVKPHRQEQCEECEYLAALERRADIYEDECKGAQ